MSDEALDKHLQWLESRVADLEEQLNYEIGLSRAHSGKIAALKRENEVLRKYADHKGYCRVRLRQLGDACICGYTDDLLAEESE